MKLFDVINKLLASPNPHQEAMKKAGASLALFAFISVFFVALTDKLTANKIAQNQERMLLKALNEVAPASRYDNNLLASKQIIHANKTGFVDNTPVYLATLDKQPAIAIFEVTTHKGYSGAITLLIGINAADKSIAGVRVVKHKETPGLGDKMELRKSPWVLDFNNKSLQQPLTARWQVKKDGGDFDQFTGATVTPRAIVNAVKSTLLYAETNLDALFHIHTQSTEAK